MTALRDILAAADPVRHERHPSEHQRERLRHAIVAAAADTDAWPSRVRLPMPVGVLVTIASIAIAMVVVSSVMWLRGGSTVQAAVRFDLRLAEDQSAPGLRAARVGSSNRIVYLHPDVIVSNADIARSSVIAGDTPSHFWIDVQLNATGAQKMREATLNHIGKPVALLVDGDVVTAPTVKSPIGAAAIISGDYTRAEAERIAAGIAVNP